MIEQQVREVVSVLLDDDVTRLEHQGYGHGSTTFAARTPQRVVYVRTSLDLSRYRATEQNLRGPASLGLPVPRVLASDLTLATRARSPTS